MTQQEHALHLAAKGFRVFPLPKGQTTPVVKFSQASTTNPDFIMRMWRAKSSKNIGIHTGDGIMVLDVDVQHGGADALIALLHEHGPLPDTYAVSTASGGAHYYFTTDTDMRNSASKVATGCDIRGHNGYVVAAGSERFETEKKCAGVYTPLNDLDPAHCPEWLEQLALGTSAAAPDGDSPVAGLLEALEHIPSGARNDRLFREACSLRQKGSDEATIFAFLQSRNATATEPLAEKELMLIARQAARYPAGSPGLNTAQMPERKKKHREDDNEAPELKKLDILKSQDLYKKDLPELNYCINPLLAEGAYLLNGRPKGGKSWLSMELATAVATGGKLWDTFEAEQGDVLYLALEDGHRRLKDRLSYFSNPEGLDLVTEGVARIGEGLTTQLQWWLDEAPNPKLIIVDILQQVMGSNDNGENAYKFDYNMMKGLQDFAGNAHICLLVVHHTRKLVTDHDMDSVSGSQGLAGAADGVWFLKSPNSGKTATLTMFSRDTDSGVYELVRAEKPNGRWEFLGEKTEEDESTKPTAVKVMAQLQADGACTVAQLAKSMKVARSHIQSVLTALIDEGAITREAEGRAFIYSLALPD